jgi:hypothetical protein
LPSEKLSKTLPAAQEYVRCSATRSLRFAKINKGEACIMTDKLDVGKALEKLRDGDEPKSRMTILDEKNKELDEKIRDLRAQRLRLERDNPGLPKRREETNSGSEALRRSPITRRLVAGILCVAFGVSLVALLVWLIR